MKMFVYSIYDILAEEFGPLFLAKNDDVAERMCKNQFKDVPNPKDYVLYNVGVFHTANGGVDSDLRSIVNLVDLMMSVPDPVIKDHKQADLFHVEKSLEEYGVDATHNVEDD